MEAELSPMDLFKEEMENDQIHLRINAVHRVKLIATVLGEEGVFQLLVPYLECKYEFCCWFFLFIKMSAKSLSAHILLTIIWSQLSIRGGMFMECIF